MEEQLMTLIVKANQAGWSFRKFRDTVAHSTGLSIKKIEKMYMGILVQVHKQKPEYIPSFKLRGWEMFIPEIPAFVDRNTSGRC